ncbi:zinc ABC transporter substrate-binding protein [Lederbergia sp. NSJ-179]|uniref:metal ABC transporter solute-binding protein, Zn/Mn family n=1 Tax=Lederbergia sp. NSJ-179 TaxID=2931402 RepID=UPI001FD22C29|nr:zinc ABC transporter substrate-binding protein [Lederbergia sp. NSJ-179]MCJ7842692.1 zinc ABC transporter substrate-binding protein [Lederbergia sp. NSJ-179]
MKTRILGIILLISILVLAACGNEQQQNKESKLTIYTTVYPLQYFTERIGAEQVSVKSVYPPGSDEHTFEPSQKDMMKLADADLFFYIGYGLEGFAQKAEKTLKNEQVKFTAIGEKIDVESQSHQNENHEEHEHDGHEHEEHEHGEEDGHHHGDVNPHLWIDPIYAKELAEQILQQLVEAKPEYKSEFEKNYKDLTTKFDQLDQDFSEMTQAAKRKQFVVAHAAYSYWESRYGLEQMAISGISSTEEPSQKKLQSIVDAINEKNVPFIFVEQNINSHLAEVIQKETGTQILHIHNLAVLTENDMQNHEDYVSLMEKNLTALKKALND